MSGENERSGVSSTGARSTRRRLWWSVAISAAALGAGGIYFARSHGDVAGVSTADVADSSHWPIGLRVRYEAAWSSIAETTAQDQETGNEVREALSRIDVQTSLELTRVPGPASQRVLAARLVDPKVKAEGVGGKQLAQDDIASELKQPFLIYFQDSGRVARVQLPEKLGTTGFSVFKSLASLLQRVEGPKGASAWNAFEPDLSGKANVAYRLSGNTLTKTKRAYLELVKADDPEQKLPGDPTVEVLSSKHVHVLGAAFDAPTQSIEVDEKTRVSLTGAFAPMESHTTLKLKQIGATEQLSKAQAEALLAGQWVSAGIDQLPSAEARDLDRQKDSVAGRSLRELATTLNQMEEAVPRNRRGEARVFSSLVSKLRIDPAALAEAAADIRAGKDQKLLLDALGSVGTPEAQALLLQLIGERRFDHEQTRSSLINVSLTPHPTPETVNALRELTSDPQHGNQALLGLGSAAHSLGEDNPESAIPLVREIEGRLEKTKQPEQQETALRALGNTGNALGLSTCEQYIVHEHLNVRLGAIACARLIPGPRADTVIAKGMMDTERQVVQAAIQAALPREYSTVLSVPLIAIAQQNQSRTLRILATEVLGRWMPDHPDLVAVVASLAEHDQDAELRTYAAGLVAKLQEKQAG